jgi:hypothetical protein
LTVAWPATFAHAAQQPSRHARGATRAPSDLGRAVPGDRQAQQPRRAADHQFQLFHRIEIESHRNAEAVAQRRGEQPLARGRADQGEGGQVDPHAARARTFADDQIERAVLHRGIEHLLDHRIEPVNFIDEQHIAFLEIGEQGSQIARLGDDRARGRAKAHAQLARDDLRQRRLAEPRRAEQQHMIERLRPAPRRLDEHAQIVARRRLADEFAQGLGTQRRILIFGDAVGGEEAVCGHMSNFSFQGDCLFFFLTPIASLNG